MYSAPTESSGGFLILTISLTFVEFSVILAEESGISSVKLASL